MRECACLVGEGLPALSGALVDGNWDLVDVLAGREERRAALGLVGGEADGHQVQPGSGQGQAPVGGDVDHGAGHTGAVPAQDHRGCGVPGVGVHHVHELVHDGVVVDGVDQEQPSRPGIGAGLVGAGGRGVRTGVSCPVHGVHGIGQHLCDRVAGGLRGIVGVDPVGVEGGELAGDADAGDVDAGRPRVARDLGGEVAGEVLPVGGVPGDGHVQVLDVEQPQLAVVTQADGHQQRVGRGLVGDVGADQIQGGVPVQAPVVAVRGATPRLAQVGGGAQVEDYGAVGELDRGDHGQGLLRVGTLGRKPAQGGVHELHGGRGARADGDHGLLDRSQQGLRPGHRVPGPAVAELGAAPAAQQEQHRPGQEDSGPAQPGQDPPGRRRRLARRCRRRREAPGWLEVAGRRRLRSALGGEPAAQDAGLSAAPVGCGSAGRAAARVARPRPPCPGRGPAQWPSRPPPAAASGSSRRRSGSGRPGTPRPAAGCSWRPRRSPATGQRPRACSWRPRRGSPPPGPCSAVARSPSLTRRGPA